MRKYNHFKRIEIRTINLIIIKNFTKDEGNESNTLSPLAGFDFAYILAGFLSIVLV